MIILYIILGLLGLLLLLLLIAVVRTLLTPSKKSTYVPNPDPKRAEAYARTLSRMLQYETVSVAETNQREKFLGFHKLLEELFPLVHRHLEKTEIDGNLLFYWKGKRHDKPIVLMSHQDVVPAEGVWEHGPFSGDIADGKVWGRGASDTKCSVMAFFQAVEELLADGYEPENDVYLSSSCTEEWGGGGCPKLVAFLEKRGVRPWLVVDEGGGIITEPIGGIEGNFAMVGVFEKGKADVRFTAHSNGGHASAPRKNSPAARLADFIHYIEHHRVFRRKMPPEVAAMFKALSPYASFPLKLVFGNLWLFRPVLLQVLPMLSDKAGAMIQTTNSAPEDGGKPGHRAQDRGEVSAGHGGVQIRRRVQCDGHPRRGLPDCPARDRRNFPRLPQQPLRADRRDRRPFLRAHLRQRRPLCAGGLRRGAAEQHARPE